MMTAQSANPTGNDFAKAHLINKCNNFMMTMNRDIRKMASKTNMKAPNAKE